MHQRDSSRRGNWPAWWVCCVLLLAGCQSLPPADTVYRARSETAVNPHSQPLLDGERKAKGKPQFLPALTPEPKTPQPIPISLDTVLRLAQDQNGQVRLARLRLDDAESDQTAANRHWLPDLS